MSLGRVVLLLKKREESAARGGVNSCIEQNGRPIYVVKQARELRPRG